ncbi:homologous-pairing protein 2 homolog [Saccoglossus kowalevskii]|uniref:Homologous-pairing protein 2 homolog n=1 Tax=Saccoglossus kowalevskii TaxID=10224 RepID=A0ABM0M230_SACKO|nr:PREDICTED: homologous-pairing protein 2 homolog [Saccoglossus kowalevskii]
MSKSKEIEAATGVLNYLNQNNRPYSAVDIFNNLHKEYGKTAVVRSLEDLANNGKIREKVYGKQKVYVADQSQFPTVEENELKEMDLKIAQLKEKVQASETEARKMENVLHGLNSTMKTEDVKSKLLETTKECKQYKERIDKLMSADNHIAPEEKNKIYSDHKTFVKEWRKRKRMATEITNAILEGYPKTKKQLFEDIGLETDEEYSVKPPDI